MHVIYGLYDPSNKKKTIRYVGYTGMNLEKKRLGHIRETRSVFKLGRKNPTHKHKWIRTLLRRGEEPSIKVLEVVSKNSRKIAKKSWGRREAKWIERLNAKGNRLTNATAGGEGLINPSKAVRRAIALKVSKLMIGNQYRKGILHTDEAKLAMSIGQKNSKKSQRAWAKRRGKPGRKISEEEKLATSKRNKGVPRPYFSAIMIALNKKRRGSCWINNGIVNKQLFPGKKLPKGWTRGRIGMVGHPCKEETRIKISKKRTGQPGPVMSRDGLRKIRESKIGCKWITDGITNRQLPPGLLIPTGWMFGQSRQVTKNVNNQEARI